MENNWLIAQEVHMDRSATAPMVWPQALMLTGDNLAHTWRVKIYDKGLPAELSGAAVTGYFVRTDGQTVVVAGTIQGNTAQVIFAQECYALPGDIKGVLRLSHAGMVMTLSMLIFRVRRELTDVIIDPGEAIPSLDDLLAQIATMEAATAAAEGAAELADIAKGGANTARDEANLAKIAANAAAGAADSARIASNAAEGLRVTAEGLRVTAETGRSGAEGLRVTAETGRSNAEGLRVTAETGRVSADGARTTAEGLRVIAENERVANENIRKMRATSYGVRWDKVNAQMVRTGILSNITTNTANFGHFGAVNVNKTNPFDSLYPWSAVKICNVNLDAYFALAPGGNLLSCVKAWDGDPDFSYNDPDGVWRYIPEFWGKSWEENGYRYFEVSDGPLPGYVKYNAGFDGRWFGGVYTRTVNAVSKTVLLPRPGMPGKSIAMSTLHTYAKNYKGTLDNIFSIDAATMLYLVEYANMNSQTALGNGVDGLYTQSAKKLTAAATAAAIVQVLTADAANCIPGAIIDIGATDGSTSIGSFIIGSAAVDGGDATKTNITLTTDGVMPAVITATTDHFWSIHGLANLATAGIGSASGYIGTNGKANAYYRGAVSHANLWAYVLGAYRQKDTAKIWIAHNENEADAYDALNTGIHIDTGLTLPIANGYVLELGKLNIPGLLSTPPFATAAGGAASSTNPVGDYTYVPAIGEVNTILLLGGGASFGVVCGRFFGSWRDPAGGASWASAARPRLKNP